MGGSIEEDIYEDHLLAGAIVSMILSILTWTRGGRELYGTG